MKTSKAKWLPKDCWRLSSKQETVNYTKSVDFKDRIKGRDNFNKFIIDYWETVKELVFEYEGGVCIEKFFYFFFFMPPKKMKYRPKWHGLKSSYNFHTDSYKYFATLVFNRPNESWGFSSGSTLKPFRMQIMRFLFDGNKPKNYYTLITTSGKIKFRKR